MSTSAAQSNVDPLAETDPRAGEGPAPLDQALSTDQVRERAVAGVAVIGLRGLLVRAIGLLGNIVLARLLVPADYGVLAFGSTFVVLAALLADGGIGGALVRRPEPPTLREMRAILGAQLGIALLIAVPVGVAGPFFGTTGLVTALVVLSLPITVLRTPANVRLERNLDYRPIAVVEVVETLAYLVWSVGSVLLGAGVWGVASALIARGVVGTVMLQRRSGLGWLRPTLDFPALRPLLSFGLKMSAAYALNTLRQQVLNLAIAAVAGVAILGHWSLTERVMMVPFLLIDTLSRVAMPAVSRLLAAGAQVHADIERAMRVGAVLLAVLLVPLAAGSPGLVVGVFGAVWAPTATAVPPACLGLVLVGPISVALGGYLYAVGEAGRMLLSMVAFAVGSLGVGLALLPALDVLGLGIGWTAACVLEGIVLVATARRHLPLRVGRVLLGPMVAALLAGGAGLVLGLELPRTLLGGMASAGAALVLYLLLVALLAPRALRAAASLSTRSVRLMRGGAAA